MGLRDEDLGLGAWGFGFWSQGSQPRLFWLGALARNGLLVLGHRALNFGP